MKKTIFAQLLSMAAIAALAVFIPACSEDKKADDNNTSPNPDAVKRAADSTACLAYSHADTTAAWKSVTGKCEKTPKNSGSALTEIKAENISSGAISIDKVKLVRVSSGEVVVVIAEATYSSNSFTMALPDTLPAAVPLNTMNIPADVSASNRNVKIASGLSFYGYRGSTKVAQLSNAAENERTLNVHLYYADGDCTMTGAADGRNYDAAIKKGWNWVYTTPSSFTTSPPSGFTNQWRATSAN
jgi:hypothetical protein